jgi:hypothetical protein
LFHKRQIQGLIAVLGPEIIQPIFWSRSRTLLVRLTVLS